jgi:hypothetical protein
MSAPARPQFDTKASTVDGKTIRLVWFPQADADSFMLYRYNPDGSRSFVWRGTATEFTETVTMAGGYRYALSARKGSFSSSAAYLSLVVTGVVVPPHIPKWVSYDVPFAGPIASDGGTLVSYRGEKLWLRRKGKAAVTLDIKVEPATPRDRQCADTSVYPIRIFPCPPSITSLAYNAERDELAIAGQWVDFPANPTLWVYSLANDKPTLKWCRQMLDMDAQPLGVCRMDSGWLTVIRKGIDGSSVELISAMAIWDDGHSKLTDPVPCQYSPPWGNASVNGWVHSVDGNIFVADWKQDATGNARKIVGAMDKDTIVLGTVGSRYSRDGEMPQVRSMVHDGKIWELTTGGETLYMGGEGEFDPANPGGKSAYFIRPLQLATIDQWGQLDFIPCPIAHEAIGSVGITTKDGKPYVVTMPYDFDTNTSDRIVGFRQDAAGKWVEDYDFGKPVYDWIYRGGSSCLIYSCRDAVMIVGGDNQPRVWIWE